MRLWWMRKIRRAAIPVEDRELFERVGEAAIPIVLAAGFAPERSGLGPLLKSGSDLYGNAMHWLVERADYHEQREQRLEFVEWAILIFVVVGVFADCAIVAHEFGWIGAASAVSR